MHKVKSRRRVSLTKWKKFWRNGRILSTRYYVTRPFRNSMPNRMFIINRLSGMAYEGLSDSSAVPRCVGGTRKMECLRLPLIWRHVFAASHSPISFSRLNRKKENGTNALYVLVGTGILEGRTTRRDENSVENTDCATHVCPSNLSIALGAPLALHADSRRAKPPPCPGFFMMLIYIYILYRSIRRWIDASIRKYYFRSGFPLFFFLFFLLFFFGLNLYSGLEEKFYFITCYIGFFVNRNEPSRIHPIRIFCIRVINFVSRFYLS